MHMFRDCQVAPTSQICECGVSSARLEHCSNQDTFEHCVLKAEGPQNCGPRISIVFKKALLQSSGKRGRGSSGLRDEPRRDDFRSDGGIKQRKFVIPTTKRKKSKAKPGQISIP